MIDDIIKTIKKSVKRVEKRGHIVREINVWINQEEFEEGKTPCPYVVGITSKEGEK